MPRLILYTAAFSHYAHFIASRAAGDVFAVFYEKGEMTVVAVAEPFLGGKGPVIIFESPYFPGPEDGKRQQPHKQVYNKSGNIINRYHLSP